jgi:uncharacterized protein (DUF1697 family)
MSTVGICLLRGVNVGGNNKIKMETLRAICEEQGLTRVETYIQSGNAVFVTGAKKLDGLAAKLELAIEAACGFRPPVVLRSLAEWREVVRRNPFAGRADVEPAKLLVTFLARALSAEERERVLAIPVSPEEVHVDGAESYIYFPEGIGRSKLPFAKLERAGGGVTGTGRNWNTVLKLLEMAEAAQR